ncbi:hypothetical protein L1049_008811 [Liquidambar formosana]|uniref:RPW8 domain-containing protein n=1 Tax=Liquidambar formosana TaxID=63359 RepID=A0AAP0S8U2_LIQFO
MSGGVIEGAALGAVAGELLKAVLEAKNQTLKFKPILRKLESTLKSLIPKIEEIEKLNQNLDFLQKDDIGEFAKLLRQGEELVRRCLEVAWWNCCKKYRYSDKLVELDASLREFAALNLQVNMSKDIKILLLGIKQLNERLDRMGLSEGNGSGTLSTQRAHWFSCMCIN